MEIGRLRNPAAALNSFAVVDVPGLGGEGGLRGWNLLAVSPSAVEAVSLVTGSVTTLYEPRASETLAANLSEADSGGCKGLAATGEVVAFVVRDGSGANTLTLKYLAQDRPVLQPLTVHGSTVAGPVRSGSHFALCSEHEVGMFNLDTGEATVLQLPREFRPMLTHGLANLKLAPGAMPVIVLQSPGSKAALCVAGEQGGQSGLLGFDPKKGSRSSFRAVPRGSSLSTSQDGVTCLCTLDAIDVFAPEHFFRVPALTLPWMPVYSDTGCLFSFGVAESPEQHLIRGEWATHAVELIFESTQLSGDTCCGVFRLGNQVLAGYFDFNAEHTDEAEGLKFAHWSLAW